MRIAPPFDPKVGPGHTHPKVMSHRAILSRVAALTGVVLLAHCGVRAGHRAPASSEPPASGPRAAHDVRRSSVDAGDPDLLSDQDQRTGWWRQAKFGMFIHWGVYTVAAGTWQGRQIGGDGAWIMREASIPVDEYAKLASRFNPTRFNAEEWVSIAQRAGMKYIVITAKHHDGFAMFRSQASRFNIVDATPFRRDPLQELQAAGEKAGIRLGFYYSQAEDWHHPGGATTRGAWDPAQKGDMDAYLRDVAGPQVRELLTGYGKLGVLWWDFPENMSRPRAEPLHRLLDLQPQVLTNDRLGGDFPGDFGSPEQYVPPNGQAGSWETCMTINDTWGYKSYDTNFKSAQSLLGYLVEAVSKGGNYLLNVGPSAEGVIPQPQVERLLQLGAWLRIHGEAIYGAEPNPLPDPVTWGRITHKRGKLYLHVFAWPSDGKLKVPIASHVARAYLLPNPGQAMRTARVPGGLSVELPPRAPEPMATVVVLEVSEPVYPRVVGSGAVGRRG
jgi:alpha-L-fucosidase